MKRILHIEDEPISARVFQRMFKKDFEITPAGPEDAIRLLDPNSTEAPFDIIVSDLQLETHDYRSVEDRTIPDAIEKYKVQHGCCWVILSGAVPSDIAALRAEYPLIDADCNKGNLEYESFLNLINSSC